VIPNRNPHRATVSGLIQVCHLGRAFVVICFPGNWPPVCLVKLAVSGIDWRFYPWALCFEMSVCRFGTICTEKDATLCIITLSRPVNFVYQTYQNRISITASILPLLDLTLQFLMALKCVYVNLVNDMINKKRTNIRVIRFSDASAKRVHTLGSFTLTSLTRFV
jgi:hypothetical protein